MVSALCAEFGTTNKLPSLTKTFFTSNSLLNDMVTRRMKQRISPEDIILLIVSSKIPSFQKSEIYDRFKIVVWDIENLVFYTKKNPILFKQLAQVTYFPIDYIEGSLCEESELAGLSVELIESEIGQEVAKEKDISVELLHRLKECEAGNEHSSEFEDICEEILRYLFEANYFNRLTRQSETEDGRFRMDLIGSLKISQNKEESIHPLCGAASQQRGAASNAGRNGGNNSAIEELRKRFDYRFQQKREQQGSRPAPDPRIVQQPAAPRSTDGMRRITRSASGGVAPLGPCAYEVGNRVEHPKFGVGMVTRIEQMAEDYKIVVDFGQYGEKTLLAKFAKLTKL